MRRKKRAGRSGDMWDRVIMTITTRRNLDIDEDTPLKIICVGGKIIIEKAEQ